MRPKAHLILLANSPHPPGLRPIAILFCFPLLSLALIIFSVSQDYGLWIDILVCLIFFHSLLQGLCNGCRRSRSSIEISSSRWRLKSYSADVSLEVRLHLLCLLQWQGIVPGEGSGGRRWLRLWQDWGQVHCGSSLYFR